MSRLAAHSAVSAALSSYRDHELRGLVEAAEPIGSGIGGTSALLNVGGTPVFVKRVPVTDLELRPENFRSTANVFELPDFCHYGVGLVGTPGFTAWRELEAHVMTTNWVLAGDHEGFPLMYHWRVLPHPGQSLSEELADADRAVAHWGGNDRLRRRIEAVRDAPASIALFLEHLPHNLHDWLGAQVGTGGFESACAMVERELQAGTSFLNARGLLHFDAHFWNILTDGERLYFADYGLAMSSEFDLSPDERRFFAEHQAYDRRYTVTHLVLWLRTALQHEEVPPQVAAMLRRHAPVAEAMTDFYREFRQNPQLSARFWNASSTSTQPPELSE